MLLKVRRKAKRPSSRIIHLDIKQRYHLLKLSAHLVTVAALRHILKLSPARIENGANILMRLTLGDKLRVCHLAACTTRTLNLLTHTSLKPNPLLLHKLITCIRTLGTNLLPLKELYKYLMDLVIRRVTPQLDITSRRPSPLLPTNMGNATNLEIADRS
jgi:hypothetical protein